MQTGLMVNILKIVTPPFNSKFLGLDQEVNWSTVAVVKLVIVEIVIKGVMPSYDKWLNWNDFDASKNSDRSNCDNSDKRGKYNSDSFNSS